MKKNLLLTLILCFSLVYLNAQTSSESGSGVAAVKSVNDTPASLPFFDNFDDGTFTEYDDLGGTTLTEISTTNFVYGAHSLHINGGTWGSGLSRSFNGKPSYLSAYVMAPTIMSAGYASSYIDIRDMDDNLIILFSIEAEVGPAINVTEWHGLGSYTAGTWYFVEFKIDYTTSTFDFYVDGTLLGNYAFRTAPTNDNFKIILHNYGGSEGYWDEIYAYAPYAGTLTTPSVDDYVNACGSETYTLDANNFVQWWDAPVGGNFVDIAQTVDVSVGTNDTVLYANSLALYPNHPSSQTGTYSGNVRGYYFTAPTDFVISALFIPFSVSGTSQTIEIVRFTNGEPPLYDQVTNDFESLGFWSDVTEIIIFCNINVSEGDIIGIYGYRDQINSYGDPGYTTHIFDKPVNLYRSGMQFPLEAGSQMHDIWGIPTSQIGNIQFAYEVAQSDRTEGFILLENEMPSITCPSDVELTVTGSYTVSGTEFDLLNATDNCNISYIMNDYNSLETLAGEVINIGNNEIVWTVADVSGNVQTCSFFVRVSDVNAVERIERDVKLFPNPTNGSFTIENIKGYNVEITDLTGKQIMSFANSADENLTVDMSSYAKGIYLVKLSNEFEYSVKKIVLE